MLSDTHCRITTSARLNQKPALLVDLALPVGVASKEYFAAVAVVQLPAEEIYGIDSKKFGEFESSTHLNM